MPRVYRSMKEDPDHPGQPLVGASAGSLGVREPPAHYADVDVDSSGCVMLNGRGMSVADHWSHLPPHRIPKRLRDDANGAVGKDHLSCWALGKGVFEQAKLTDGLELVLKPRQTTRGNVVPSGSVSLTCFQAALAETQPLWSIDETAHDSCAIER